MLEIFKKINLTLLLALATTVYTVSGFANVVGTTSQNFNTTANSDDFVTVYSAKTIGQGRFGLGLFINTAVNSLPYFENDETEYEKHSASRSKFNDTLIGGELAIAYGILANVDLTLNLPGILYQQISQQEQIHGEYSKQGLTEYRVGSKIRLLGNNLYGIALIGSANFNTTGDDPYAGKQKGPTYNGEIASDFTLGELTLAANLGYRWKTAAKGDESLPSPTTEAVGNQIISSGAVGYELRSIKSRLVAEVFTSAPTSAVNDHSGRHTTSGEGLLGLKIKAANDFVYHVGAGSELRHSLGSPDWRFYAGLNWATSAKSSPAMSVKIAERKPDEVFVTQAIQFKFNQDGIIYSKETSAYLSNLVKNLNQKPFERLIIEGHTCSIGKAPYNLALSQKRADNIKHILVSQYGVDASKIVSIGHGEQRPIANNYNEKGRQLNRRVEFKIYRTTFSLAASSKGKSP